MNTRLDPPLPLRARRRSQLIADVRAAALQLFARNGFDAVTVEDIAAAAGISKSTFFRVVSGKDSLLIDPLLEGISTIVAAFDNRPASEGVVDALIAAMVDCTTVVESAETELWCTAVRSAPHLISRVTLVGPGDRAALIAVAARRLGVTGDPAADPRPGLLITVALAASEYTFRTWITDPRCRDLPLPRLVEDALHTVLVPDWAARR
ncbi:TetR family transcriptional regulator [Nocardia sp. alder85J]|uniref:TetR family transcriptional regulator n=1 Tax=Nocardia sp. alder85J TaxID=2862949 RepID=UPI001CD1E1BA|nr:TetR family transcriptional regulator [Nocardia sp. alder85J]MCX4093000.1 TetR family transcriptional regulator [Nocardia sp. alder85J]